ncbi:MAG: family 10 glycosylhydrolase [Lachnospiraceae bacterium]|nr:family 10 glycosylhydrolase [Lachnospiraceae bacterium]
MKDSFQKKLLLAGTLFLVAVTIIFLQGLSNVNVSEGKNEEKISLSASYIVTNGQALVKVQAVSEHGLKELRYQKGNVTSTANSKWKSAEKITGKQFSARKKGTYSIRAVDEAGNKKVCKLSVALELKAVWIYFDEFYKKAASYSKWKSFINSTYTTCKNNHINAVFLQVRPFADAMYPSDYYPWSRYATGTPGKDPGFDPLAYAVKAAHENGIAIHAWINPYRITVASMKKSMIPKGSIARKWIDAKSRNVIKYAGAYYFNPSKQAVRDLVANGVREMVENYDLDGIHMDDYFYPTLGTANFKKFDYKEYKKSDTDLSLVAWRRENVNKMVRQLYKTVKSIDKTCLFGISPAGNLSNLYSNYAYYSDVKKWMGTTGYVDYICPQLYWSFKQKVAPYKKFLGNWVSIKRHESVDMYIGLGAYRAGISKAEAKKIYDMEWSQSNTVLKRQVLYARKTKQVDGFVLFSYSSLKSKKAKKEIKNLKSVF